MIFQDFAVEIIYLVALLGMGRFVLTCIDKNGKWGPGLWGVIGLSSLVVLGGLLNLFKLTSGGLCIAILAAGAFYWLLRNKGFLLKFQNKQSLFFYILIIAIIIIKMVSAILLPMNFHDDFHAYLVLPSKILSMGGMGADPFMQRRIEGSLGASSFLQATILALADPFSLNILEHGVSLILLLLMLIEGCTRRPLLLGGILLISFLTPYTNISSVLSGSVLFYALFYLMGELDETKFGSRLRIILFALIGSTLVALKSNFIPTVALSLLAYYGYKIVKKKYTWQEFVGVAGLSLLLLLPWMMDMYRSCGTFLYPLLGKGYHGSVYGTVLTPSYGLSLKDSILKALGIVKSRYFDINLILFLFYYGMVRFYKERINPTVLCIYAACLLSAVVLYGWIIPGTDRYIFSGLFASSIFLIQQSLHVLKNKPCLTTVQVKMVYALAGLMIVLLFKPVMENLSTTVRIFQQPYQNDALSPKSDQSAETSFSRTVYLTPNTALAFQEKIHAMQEAIPRHVNILAYLSYPFLMDFKRNTVFVMDIPGSSSLPPGLPLDSDEKFSQYLRSKNIRYIAYSYSDQENFPLHAFQGRISSTDPWIRSTAINTFKFQNLLNRLANSNRIIYQDSYCYVLDMGTEN